MEITSTIGVHLVYREIDRNSSPYTEQYRPAKVTSYDVSTMQNSEQRYLLVVSPLRFVRLKER